MLSQHTRAEALAGSGQSQRVALRCTALVKRYGKVTAVDGLGLEIRAGECFGLLGPNGAGKTTTMEILEGLTPRDGGSVEVLGKTWGKGNDHELRERLGIQLQEAQFADKLTVKETVTLFRSFYSRGREVDEVISALELQEKRDALVGGLSIGQKQRLSLACALVNNPELLFLDEPTAGLDPQVRLKIWEVIEEFNDGGGTTLLTTHYMEEAARLCDRISIIDHGRLIALGTEDELIRSLDAEQIIEFSVEGQLDDALLASLPGVRRVVAKNGSYRLTVSDVGAALRALLTEVERQRLELIALTTHQATLEDVFVSLTGKMLRDA